MNNYLFNEDIYLCMRMERQDFRDYDVVGFPGILAEQVIESFEKKLWKKVEYSEIAEL